MARNKPVDFVCIGSATQDAFVRSDASKILTLSEARAETRLLAFEYGAKIGVEHMEFTTGGGATNAAVSLARLGARTAFLGKIGKDEMGQLVLRELAAAGIDTSRHLVSRDLSTGYSVILTSYTGDRTVLTYRGASTEIGAEEVDWPFVRRAKWLYLTSLAGGSASLLGPIARRARGVRIAFNPGSAQLRAGLAKLRVFLAATDVLLLNKEEAARLTGKAAVRDTIIGGRCTLCEECVRACPAKVFVRDEERIVASAVDRCVKCGRCVAVCRPRAMVMEPWAFNASESFAVLCRTGPKAVVVTDGENGSQASDGRTVWLLPAQDVPVASTLGAGDAFGSAFAFEYARTGDVGRALALGTANAASVVQVVGAKRGLLDEAGARKALEAFDGSVLRTHRLKDLLAAARG